MFVSFRRSGSRSVPRRPHQRTVWPGASGARQGRRPANHPTGAPQAASWSASANQHQVSEMEVFPGESSQVKVPLSMNSSERERLLHEPSCLSCRYWPRSQTVRVTWPSSTSRCSSAAAMHSAAPTSTAAWSLHWACSVCWRPHCDSDISVN